MHANYFKFEFNNRSMKKLVLTFGLLLVMVSLSTVATSQINLKSKLKNQINNRVNNKVDKGINKGLDSAEKGATDAVKNDDKPATKTEPAKTEPKQQITAGKNTVQGDEKAQTAEAELQAYSKYDFIPGEKVIFYEDFSQDAVGDFPALWNTNGSAEVVTTNLFPGNWMKFVSRDAVWTDALLNLPENYTIEFDVIPIKGTEGGMAGYDFRLLQSINAKAFDYGSVPGKAGFCFSMEYYGRPGYRTYINGNEGQGLDLSGSNEFETNKQKLNQKYHMALWMQKSRVRLYQNEAKVFDLPKAFPLTSVKMDRLRFEDGAAMVTNVRIAVGAPDMRSKLITEGKLVSYGIYFDVNKDVVKPESYGTLKGIADVLKENPDVRVKIVGHTDGDGADAANLDLSKRRGSSVKNELVKTFGIDVSRLESDGMGKTQPVAPNDTPANKALNRRVEFIKL
jgi:outer membrane protein OmpA-like peptidoglycan-associated protein